MKDDPRKIILFIKGLGLGGAERHVADLAIALHQRYGSVKVIYILPHKNALVDEIRDSGVEVTCVGRGLWWLSVIPLLFLELFRFKPTLVHAHLPVPGFLSRFFKPFFRYRLVYTEHNMFARLHPVTRLVHKFSKGIDDVSISCSEAVAKSLPWESAIINNGIFVPDISPTYIRDGDLRKSLGISSSAVVFICVANLYKKKNHRLLIESFDDAFKSLPSEDVALLLVGHDGTERGYLEGITAKLPTSASIYFLGARPHAKKLLLEADVFCLSSNFEGLPIALLESMSLGLPSVVTDAGGMGVAVRNGESGFVVPVNDKEQFSRSLFNLFSDSKLRQRMGTRAFNLAKKNFSQSRMLDDIVALYI